MKKSIMLSISLLIGCLNGMLYCMDEKEFTLVRATPSEDLSRHKKMIDQLYLQHTNPGEEAYTKRAIDANFSIVERWIRQKEEGKHLFNLLDKEKLVGCTTIEELNKERLAIHLSATLPEYASLYPLLLKLVQQEFPNAQTISTTSSSKIKGLEKILEMLGFVQDDAYSCNKELAVVIEEPVGYTKRFD